MNLQKTHILIVDDDKKYALELKNRLREIGEVDIAFSEDEFFTFFSPYKYDLILLDLRLRKKKGDSIFWITLLKRLHLW